MESKQYRTPFEEYIAEMKPELSANQVRQILKRGSKLPAIISRPEIKALMGAAKGERNMLIVRTFYATGVRNEECKNFLVADVHYDDRVMSVREGKGCKDRPVCVDDRTLDMLRDYTRHMRLDAPLFGLKTTKQLYNIVVKCGEAVGLVQRYAAIGRRFSPHALRHSFGTHMHESGADVIDLKRLLGHEYLATTELYVEVSMSHLHQVYDRAHEFGSKERAAHPPPTGLALRRDAEVPNEAPRAWAHVMAQYRKCHPLAQEAGP